MKRATAIILAVCALFSIITYTAKADDHPFSDVPEDHLCKQAIYELYNLRIITGNKGRFNPDKAITYAEAITILEKTFGKAERLPAWKWWGTKSDEYKGWINDWTDRLPQNINYHNKVDYQTAVYLMFDINKISENCIQWIGDVDTKQILRQLGYTPIYKNGTYISRGHFCHIVYWMLTIGTKRLQYCECLAETAIVDCRFCNTIEESEINKRRSAMITGITDVPYEVVLHFVHNNGKIKIYDRYTWLLDINAKFKTALGLYKRVNNEHSICLCSTSQYTIQHEFGHYVYYFDPNTDKQIANVFDNMRNEVNSVIELTSLYANTNKKEFFAEAFIAYCNMPEELKESAPNTYHIINDAVNYLITSVTTEKNEAA